MILYLLAAMELIDMIKSCTTVEEIELLEWLFDFDERHREAALWHRIILWSKNMERGLEIERHGVFPELLKSWTEQQREWFINDWHDDSFLTGMEDPTMEVFEPLDELLEETAIQTGEGSRKRPFEASASQSKKSKTVPLFTIKSVKQVKVKKFKTTGLDYRVQFNDLQVSGLPTVLRRLHQVFDSLLDRVTDGVAVHDQVRFVMHSPQIEYPISLLFMSREKLTVERILAEIERVIQFNDTFTLDD